MKRPPGLWILLSAGVLWLSLQNADGIRASSLIHSKSTSTTTELPVEDTTSASASSDETATEPTSDSNTTKPTLTGNPQIDYVYDPNLPQELNGYNLSDYPFYERVPEEIDFKCDGLHDGFYASVIHKCQVYHHCLFGTRYDFLCANYTAFDQRTFICHFASEVDCVNSKKFWHRNDALYKAESTTTIKPTFVYTPPAQPPAILSASPSQSIPAIPGAPQPPARPAVIGGRRPVKRIRPYDYYEYDDYEDYYDEPVRPRRRKRPRPRRPIYEDEYDYEEDRYEKRGSGRRAGGYKGRPYRRRKRPYDDEDYDAIDVSEDRRRNPDDDIRRPMNRRKNGDRYHKRRPIDDDYEDRIVERPRKGARRPIYDDEDEYDYDDQQTIRRSSEKNRRDETDNKPVAKPASGGSIYDRPRAAPRIKPPVPKSEANKYSQKTTPAPAKEDEEYYDEYEEEPAPKLSRPARKPDSSPERGDSRDDSPPRKAAASSRHRTHSVKRPDYADDDLDREPNGRNKSSRQRPRNGERVVQNKRKPVIEYDYYDDEEIEPKVNQEKEKGDGYRTRSNNRNEDIETSSRTKNKDADSLPRNRNKDGDSSPRREQPQIRQNKFVPQNKKQNDARKEEPLSEAEKESSADERSPLRPESKNRVTSKKDEVPSDIQQPPDERGGQSSLDTRGKNKENNRSSLKVYNRTKYTSIRDRTTTSTQATPTSSEVITKEKPDHVVRIVKRPFLPSRGGSPYAARGLQPVGSRANEKNVENLDVTGETDANNNGKQQSNLRPRFRDEDIPENIEEADDEPINDEPAEEVVKPTPTVIKVPIRKVPVQKNDAQENIQPYTPHPLAPGRPHNNYREFEGPRTTQEPKIEDTPGRNPLDIAENEYDVTLNDALNPTLPNLPVRGLPTGFSSATDYTFNAFQRPRYVVDPVLTQASSDHVYQRNKPPPPHQRFDTIYQSFTNTDNNYKGQYSTLNSQVSHANLNPRVVQHAQTQAFYPGY